MRWRVGLRATVSAPFAGMIRFRFGGCDLSPGWDTPADRFLVLTIPGLDRDDRNGRQRQRAAVPSV